jgi:hypothetical protein
VKESFQNVVKGLCPPTNSSGMTFPAKQILAYFPLLFSPLSVRPTSALASLSFSLGLALNERVGVAAAEAKHLVWVKNVAYLINQESNLSTEATVADSFSIGIKIVLSFLSLKENVGPRSIRLKICYRIISSC